LKLKTSRTPHFNGTGYSAYLTLAIWEYSIALPTGLLLSPLKTWFEKKLLLETYAASHRAYLNRSGFLVRWTTLCSNLEASLSLATILENDRAPTAKIALRSNKQDHVYSKISLLVEAHSVVGTYQEVVTLHNIGNLPIIAALSSIPLRAIHITEQMKLFQSFDEFTMSLLEVQSSESVPFDPNKIVWSTHPSNFELLNDRFEQRWGAFWNMAAIDSDIQERAHWFTFHLATQKIYYASNDQIPFSYFPTAILRQYVGRPLCWILTRQWLLRAYFWLPIFLHMRKLEVADG